VRKRTLILSLASLPQARYQIRTLLTKRRLGVIRRTPATRAFERTFAPHRFPKMVVIGAHGRPERSRAMTLESTDRNTLKCRIGGLQPRLTEAS
jgi:hypothetical protein